MDMAMIEMAPGFPLALATCPDRSLSHFFKTGNSLNLISVKLNATRSFCYA